MKMLVDKDWVRKAAKLEEGYSVEAGLMNIFKYQLSFYAYIRTEQIIYPKWWEFWKKPETVERMNWVRQSILLYEDEGKLLLCEWNEFTLSPTWCMLLRAISNVKVDNTRYVQIEDIGGRASNYITSEYVATEDKT